MAEGGGEDVGASNLRSRNPERVLKDVKEKDC